MKVKCHHRNRDGKKSFPLEDKQNKEEINYFCIENLEYEINFSDSSCFKQYCDELKNYKLYLFLGSEIEFQRILMAKKDIGNINGNYKYIYNIDKTIQKDSARIDLAVQRKIDKQPRYTAREYLANLDLLLFKIHNTNCDIEYLFDNILKLTVYNSRKQKQKERDEHKEIYDKIFKDIGKNSVTDITSPFYRNVSSRLQNSKDSIIDNIIDKYYILYKLLDDIRNIFANFIKAPNREVEMQLKECCYGKDINDMLNIANSKVTSYYYQKGSSHSPFIPEHYIKKEFIKSYNTYMNKYLKYLLNKIIKIFNQIIKELTRTLDETDSLYNAKHIEDILKKKNRINLKERLSSIKKNKVQWEEIAKIFKRRKVTLKNFNKNSPPAETLYNPKFQTYKTIDERLEQILLLSRINKGKYPFKVISYSDIYEKWSFIKTFNFLKDIGYKNNTELETVGIFSELRPNKAYRFAIDGKNKFIKLFFSKKYEVYDKDGNYNEKFGLIPSRYDITEYKGKPKRAPDISLEFYDHEDQSKPKHIIVLDATIASHFNDSIIRPKWGYMDAIRDFEKKDKDGYAKEIVRASWVLSPKNKYIENKDMKSSKFIDWSGRPKAYRRKRLNNSFYEGAFKLVPYKNSLKAYKNLLIYLIKNFAPEFTLT